MKKDCTTCAWGVAWSRHVISNHLVGHCRWECPVPHPDNWGQFALFNENSEPKNNCPAWKWERNSRELELRQQWQEEHEVFLKRIDSERERLVAEYKAKYGNSDVR